ncbi:MAGE family-domain-containing protein [Hyaloraphidium curvatum]|nr:MAGE family-domain-containing protein [Hyaloraphidium curvatum]
MAPPSGRRRRAFEEDEEEISEPEERPKTQKKGKGKARQQDSGDDDDAMEVDDPPARGKKRRERPDEREEGGEQAEEREEEPANQQQVSRAEKYAKEKLSEEEIKKMVSGVVRLALFMQNKVLPIRKEDIKAKVLKDHAKAMDYIIDRAREQLKTIFGMDLAVLPIRERKPPAPGQKKDAAADKQAASKSFALVSVLPPAWSTDVINWNGEEADMGFLSVLLCLIYVKGGPSKGSLSHHSLNSYLAKMGDADDLEAGITDEQTKLIDKFVKQGYLDKRKTSTQEGDEISYVWGPRAKVEFPDNNIVDMIASYYTNSDDAQLKANIRRSARMPEPQPAAET